MLQAPKSCVNGTSACVKASYNPVTTTAHAIRDLILATSLEQPVCHMPFVVGAQRIFHRTCSINGIWVGRSSLSRYCFVNLARIHHHLPSAFCVSNFNRAHPFVFYFIFSQASNGNSRRQLPRTPRNTSNHVGHSWCRHQQTDMRASSRAKHVRKYLRITRRSCSRSFLPPLRITSMSFMDLR